MESIQSDLTITGGGLAGVCAAITAAREGIRVALVNNRPVLGGNSSSEMRVWTRGATGGGNLFAEEMGILGELKLENLYRNMEGSALFWDEVLLDFVLREPNLSLFLNTYVTEVELGADQRITGVKGHQLGSEKEFRFESPLFLDATGDGTVGYLAGAEFRRGREGKSEFGELFAMDQADSLTLGSTIFFQTKPTPNPVRFVAPSYAYSVDEIKKLLNRGGRIANEKMSGCDYWWLEYGGVLDTISDNEAIRLELKKIALGIWNYIKNSGEYDAGNMTLEWIGAIPAKRESRRLIGDYLLTQNDIMRHQNFDDAVCYGGWYLDFHPPEGIYSGENFCEQIPVTIYGIPMRCLYSKNIGNLLFAGRDISVTHAAFASTRIMNTCALTGQAAGMIAAFAVRTGKSPQQLYHGEREAIRQRLLGTDMLIIGCRNDDADDRAKQAEIRVSSVRRTENSDTSRAFPVEEDLLILFPWRVGDGHLQLKMDIHADTVLEVELNRCERPEGYRRGEMISGQKLKVRPGQGEWMSIPAEIPETGSYYLLIKKNPKVAVYGSDQSCTGFLGGWAGRKILFNPCFKLNPAGKLYGPENLSNGFNRPYILPNLWISDKVQCSNEWLSLTWKTKMAIREIRLFFNPDLSRELTNLRGENWSEHHGFIPRLSMPPELVKDYQIHGLVDGAWRKLAEVRENRKRMAVHTFEEVVTDQIRIEFEKTHGSPYIEVFEVRVY
jgi:hypothetical protein